jgi:hypothetical protein
MQAMADAHRFDHWGWIGGLVLSRALAEREDRPAEAVRVIEAALAKRRAMGARFGRVLFRAWTAEVHALCGDAATAESWMDAALAAVDQTEERWGDCLVYLARAELLRMRGAGLEEIRAWLQRAGRVADEQDSAFLRARVQRQAAALA